MDLFQALSQEKYRCFQTDLFNGVGPQLKWSTWFSNHFSSQSDESHEFEYSMDPRRTSGTRIGKQDVAKVTATTRNRDFCMKIYGMEKRKFWSKSHPRLALSTAASEFRWLLPVLTLPLLQAPCLPTLPLIHPFPSGSDLWAYLAVALFVWINLYIFQSDFWNPSVCSCCVNKSERLLMLCKLSYTRSDGQFHISICSWYIMFPNVWNVQYKCGQGSFLLLSSMLGFDSDVNSACCKKNCKATLFRSRSQSPQGLRLISHDQVQLLVLEKCMRNWWKAYLISL